MPHPHAHPGSVQQHIDVGAAEVTVDAKHPGDFEPFHLSREERAVLIAEIYHYARGLVPDPPSDPLQKAEPALPGTIANAAETGTTGSNTSLSAHNIRRSYSMRFALGPESPNNEIQANAPALGNAMDAPPAAMNVSLAHSHAPGDCVSSESGTLSGTDQQALSALKSAAGHGHRPVALPRHTHSLHPGVKVHPHESNAGTNAQNAAAPLAAASLGTTLPRNVPEVTGSAAAFDRGDNPEPIVSSDPSAYSAPASGAATQRCAI